MRGETRDERRDETREERGERRDGEGHDNHLHHLVCGDDLARRDERGQQQQAERQRRAAAQLARRAEDALALGEGRGAERLAQRRVTLGRGAWCGRRCEWGGGGWGEGEAREWQITRRRSRAERGLCVHLRVGGVDASLPGKGCGGMRPACKPCCALI